MIFTMLAALSAAVLSAQEITVSGIVTDSSDGSPVPYASVHLAQAQMTMGNTALQCRKTESSCSHPSVMSQRGFR